MITLALVRHAKSDWGTPALADHERPLNARGLRDGPQQATKLAGTGWRPDLILSSTALRARTTAEFFATAFGLDPQLRDELYGAPAATLLDAAAGSGSRAVLIVAHDPGMTVLAEQLSGGGIGHMPTCAIATFLWRTAPSWDVASAIAPDNWDFRTPQ